MVPLKIFVFFALLSISLYSILVSLLYSPKEDPRILLTSSPPTHTYQFENPSLAYYLLSQLDLYEPLGVTKEGKRLSEHVLFFYGLKTDSDYCNKHRAHFVHNPEFVFKEKNFVSSNMQRSDLKIEWLRLIGGSDAMPHIHGRVLKSMSKQQLHDIRPDIQVFYFSDIFRRKINKEFACTTQWFNHIPGQVLSRKDLVTEAINEYQAQYKSQPDCLDTDKFFLKTWVMKEKSQCEEFFMEFNSPRYQQLKEKRGTVYFRKIGMNAHQGMGVFPVDSNEEDSIRELYNNGSSCGKVDTNNLIQYAIHNPLLINGRKADFRYYIFIASTNPLIVYYNDGYFSVSLNQFDPYSANKSTVLTNFRLTNAMFKNSKKDERFKGMSQQDMEEDTIWTFERFQDYLLKKGLISDQNWLDSYFRPELMKMTVHLIRLANESFTRRTSIYEIFGVDVVMDEDFGIWFIEANANPGLESFPAGSRHVIHNLVYDAFEVLFGLLRSRAKRIIHHINTLTRDQTAWVAEGEDVQLVDVEKRRVEFQQITRNYFEPEFETKARGKMLKVIDENYSGPERYQNLLPMQCEKRVSLLKGSQ